MSDNGGHHDRWEYQLIVVSPGNPCDALNKEGAKGWEVCACIGMTPQGQAYVMKRKVLLVITAQRLRDGIVQG